MRKSILRATCIAALSFAVFSAQAATAKLLSSTTKKIGKPSLQLSEANISPYLPLKAFVITNYYIVYQIYSGEPNSYYVNVRFGAADDYGVPHVANTPVDLTIYGSVSSTDYTGPYTATIPAGQGNWYSPTMFSSYVPTVQITSISPSSINLINIETF